MENTVIETSLVDDEAIIRQNIRYMLKVYPSFTVVNEADNKENFIIKILSIEEFVLYMG